MADKSKYYGQTYAESTSIADAGNFTTAARRASNDIEVNTVSQNADDFISARESAEKRNKQNSIMRKLNSNGTAPYNIINRGTKLTKDGKYNRSMTQTGPGFVEVENGLHAGAEVFDSINKYRGHLKEPVAQLSGPAGGTVNAALKDDGSFDTNPDGTYKYSASQTKTDKIIYSTVGSPSLFNPFYAVPAVGITEGIPLLDTTKASTKFNASEIIGEDGSKIAAGVSATQEYNVDINDCSIANLVKLSKQEYSILGHARYKYSDFMYCRDVGKISNNHMITLRKFPTPIRDNIYLPTTIPEDGNASSNLELSGDVGRMITWFGTPENKLEDILNFTFHATWKPLDAKIEEKNSEESEQARGLMGGLVNIFSNGYNNASAKGTTPNALALLLGQSGSNALLTNAPYANNPVVNGAMYDKNKVYEPKDTVRSTHTYEGKLEFNNEFTLTFNYKLRGYDNINPKSAFLDLIGNILAVTYRRGTFWGGEQHIIGAPQNKAGWKKAEEFTNGTLDAGGTLISSIISGGDASGAFKTFGNSLSANFSNATGMSLKSLFSADGLNNILDGLKDANYGNALKGMFHNQLGRPAVYAFDSLLTNDAVGLWHVTIGNPLNPIVSMGNLIITGVKLSQSGPLGLDDFPTELKVEVQLKHATPRDAIDIQKMYTKGTSGIYMQIGNTNSFKALQAAGYKGTDHSAESELERLQGSTSSVSADSGKGDTSTTMGNNRTTLEVSSAASAITGSKSEEYVGWVGDFSVSRIGKNVDSLR